MSMLGKILDMVFGPEVYCAHGKTGKDGVCMDCCNDLYGDSEDEGAEVVDFDTYRDTI